jgi:hypothetical protein
MANVINIEYSKTLTNFTMIDGLTIDIVKRKYIWLLNAIVENAIIGQDDYGLVWYSGNWLAGEWEDGTWYSGIWYDGEWKNGKFYSYRFDTRQLLLRNKRVLEKDNPIYSQFRNGIWRRGEFFNGYFGPEVNILDWDYQAKVDLIFSATRWESGTFYNGVFRNTVWLQSPGQKSIFKNGIFYNSEWLNGTFLNGTFQGYMWWDGNFTGGDFIFGQWITGTFSQSNPNIKSRFGSMPITGNTMIGTSVIWYDGQFISGEFHSGLNIISGVTSVSDNHNRTWWMAGDWYKGSWYGGTHVSGQFFNGNWYEGFWSGGTFNNGVWYNGFWLDGDVNNGLFIQGLFKNVIFRNGELGYQPPEYLIEQERVEAKSKIVSNPKFLASAPTVVTNPVTNVSITTITCGGNVISDGGEAVIARGVCWSTEVYPTIINNYTTDGIGAGIFTSSVTGLLPETIYYIRAYAANSLRTVYGEQFTFTTLFS